MDDANNSKHRLDAIKQELPNANQILDMSSGCGTFVYFGLLNNFLIYGIEPEEWKHKFNELKSLEKSYPNAWISHFLKGVGEHLPYDDERFDCVSSYQTLEHVQDVRKCISEMLRVTKSGGGIHIKCPDYRSFFEPHYLLPWLPLFPRKLARIYLWILRRPLSGLDTINYVTTPFIKRLLIREGNILGKKLEIIDLNRKQFTEALDRRGMRLLSHLYPLYRLAYYLKILGRREIDTNLFVHCLED